MAKITHGQLIKRDMFQRRIKEGKEIYFHELFYPLLQGYDSVIMKVNGEVGGNDQTFNMLVGRDLVKQYQNREKLVIATKLLINPVTKEKLMSKSEGNYIALNDPPKEMYGKVMALPDEVILPCFELCTEVPQERLNKIKSELKKPNTNPRSLKAELAKELVTLYHGEKAANETEKEFEKVFKEKKLPSKIPVFKTHKEKYPVLDLLVDTKLASSKSEAKRLIQGGGVKTIISNRESKIDDWQTVVKAIKEPVIQVGKRRFIKVKFSK